MRAILRKIAGHVTLDAGEYERLLNYIEELRAGEGNSYRVFYENYGAILERDYGVYLSRFPVDRADLVEFIMANPATAAALQRGRLPLSSFPPRFRDYLRAEYGEFLEPERLRDILDWVSRGRVAEGGLPRAREGEPVLVYEAGNANKEWGLKQHFTRLARYPFITRLATVRYLTRNKAKIDRFKVQGDDLLAGIYTNREKSFYFLVYLTEAVPFKTENACRLLNLVFYG